MKTPITTLFLDIGGVLLTNGWDHHARRRAAKHFKLDWAEMEQRHGLNIYFLLLRSSQKAGRRHFQAGAGHCPKTRPAGCQNHCQDEESMHVRTLPGVWQRQMKKVATPANLSGREQLSKGAGARKVGTANRHSGNSVLSS